MPAPKEVKRDNALAFMKEVDVTLHKNLRSQRNQSDIHEELKTALSTGNLAIAIERLAELKDFNNGINWIINDEASKDFKHGILIRDARKVVDNPTNAYYGQAIMALNFIRAAQKLLAIEGKDPELINVDIEKLLKEIETKYEIEGEAGVLAVMAQFNKEINSNLARHLGISESESATRMKKARDFMNFDDTHRHVVTVDSIPGYPSKYIFQAEIIKTELTDEQKLEYKNKKEKEWYQALPIWQRKLVDAYENDITGGRKVIPTQLRDCVIGARNAGMKISGLGGEDATPEITDISFHSGTVSHLGKKVSKSENQRIAAMNARQYQSWTEKPIHMLTLNAEYNITGNDREIVLNSAYAMKANSGFTHSNVCFNIFRLFTPNRYAGIQSKLNMVADKFEKDHPQLNQEAIDLCRYIKGKRAKGNYHMQLEKIDSMVAKGLLSHEESMFLISAVNCRHAIKMNILPLDADNRNLVIGSSINFIDNYIKDMPGFAETVSACQSGKDRDGILMNETTNLSVSTSKTFKENRSIQAQITNQTSKSGHQAFMAGIQGGTLGCFGIKKDSQAALPDRYPEEVQSNLIQPEASYNGKFYGVDKPKGLKMLKLWFENIVKNKPKEELPIIFLRDATRRQESYQDEVNNPTKKASGYENNNTMTMLLVKLKADRDSILKKAKDSKTVLSEEEQQLEKIIERLKRIHILQVRTLDNIKKDALNYYQLLNENNPTLAQKFNDIVELIERECFSRKFQHDTIEEIDVHLTAYQDKLTSLSKAERTADHKSLDELKMKISCLSEIKEAKVILAQGISHSKK